MGPAGAQGPPGPAGSTAATIPFSIGQYGSSLGTDTQGTPNLIHFLGFGTEHPSAEYLEPGVWESGTIIMRENMPFGTSFILPHDGIVKNIHVLFSTQGGMYFEPGVIVYPFACLAVSNTSSLVYTVLQNTITYTEPYLGGVEYNKHVTRRGSLDLNIPIAEGTLMAIIVGMRAENTTVEQHGAFAMCGGIYIE